MIADIFTLTDFEKVVKMEKDFHVVLNSEEMDRIFTAMDRAAFNPGDRDLIEKLKEAWNRSESVER